MKVRVIVEETIELPDTMWAAISDGDVVALFVVRGSAERWVDECYPPAGHANRVVRVALQPLSGA